MQLLIPILVVSLTYFSVDAITASTNCSDPTSCAYYNETQMNAQMVIWIKNFTMQVYMMNETQRQQTAINATNQLQDMMKDAQDVECKDGCQCLAQFYDDIICFFKNGILIFYQILQSQNIANRTSNSIQMTVITKLLVERARCEKMNRDCNPNTNCNNLTTSEANYNTAGEQSRGILVFAIGDLESQSIANNDQAKLFWSNFHALLLKFWDIVFPKFYKCLDSPNNCPKNCPNIVNKIGDFFGVAKGPFRQVCLDTMTKNIQLIFKTATFRVPPS